MGLVVHDNNNDDNKDADNGTVTQIGQCNALRSMYTCMQNVVFSLGGDEVFHNKNSNKNDNNDDTYMAP